jgi:hypothetical protein
MRRALVALSVLFATLAGIPASAGGPMWKPYPCPSGMLLNDPAQIGQPVGGRVPVTIPGLMACGVPEPGPQFAVAGFEQGLEFGRVNGQLVRNYALGSGPTKFLLTGEVSLVDSARPIGFCLMPDENTRLSCVEVFRDGVYVSVVPLSTSDPLVTKPLQWGDYPPLPCPSCWRTN